jgi:hypothetical protein
MSFLFLAGNTLMHHYHFFSFSGNYLKFKLTLRLYKTDRASQKVSKILPQLYPCQLHKVKITCVAGL